MMKNIRRDDSKGQNTVIMNYGDSIAEGLGSTDYCTMSSWSLLNMAFKTIDPSFQIEERSWSRRCANQHTCPLSCNKKFAEQNKGKVEYDWRCD